MSAVANPVLCLLDCSYNLPLADVDDKCGELDYLLDFVQIILLFTRRLEVDDTNHIVIVIDILLKYFRHCLVLVVQLEPLPTRIQRPTEEQKQKNKTQLGTQKE